MKLDPAFEEHIQHIETVSLDLSGDPIFMLNTAFNIVGYNKSYVKFAVENGLPEIESMFGIGTDVLNVIPNKLKAEYQSLWINVLQRDSLVEYDYECSSPEKYRKYHQSVYSIKPSIGLLITNHCISENKIKNQNYSFQK